MEWLPGFGLAALTGWPSDPAGGYGAGGATSPPLQTAAVLAIAPPPLLPEGGLARRAHS